MKKLISIMLFFTTFLMLTACQKIEKNEDKLKLVASSYPVFITAVNVIGDVPEVELVCMNQNAEGCFHDYQITTEDLKNIESSNSFIINGAGFEPFVEKITENLPKIKIIDASREIDLINNGKADNPHTWLSIENNIQQVKNITDGICEIDSKNKNKYKENAEKYINKLENLKQQMHEKLDKIRGFKVITYHDAFDYLVKELGLEIVDFINCEHDHEPTAAELVRIFESAKKKDVKAILYESGEHCEDHNHEHKSEVSSNDICQLITQETGVPNFGLLSGVYGCLSNNMYISIIEHNIEVLQNINQ